MYGIRPIDKGDFIYLMFASLVINLQKNVLVITKELVPKNDVKIRKRLH